MITNLIVIIINFVAALEETSGGHSIVQSPLVEDNAQGTEEGMGRDADSQEGASAGGVGGKFGLLFDIFELFVNYTPSPGTMIQLLNDHFQFL
jgi:hypothetical protein